MAFFVYFNTVMLAKVNCNTAKQSEAIVFNFNSSKLKSDDVVRFVVRNKNLNENDFEQLTGTISINILQYFSPKAGFPLNQRRDSWMTLFDDPVDDVFDGVIGEDDEENPKIRIGFELKDQTVSLDKEEEMKSKKFV